MDGAVDALQVATRVLVAVASRSVETLSGPVSLPQFRLLLVLNELGCGPSSRVAAALGTGASSVTRLADRLVASGHLLRGSDPRNRSVVTLELTAAGRALVDRVMRWRHDELRRILSRLESDERAAVTRSLRRFAEAAGPEYSVPTSGPVAV
ncbi:MarR family winged helix-turn-helix transcriptional regulator [Actinoallomurus iriomotensis]|uniref:MarR family transcriptional regulator n=1 Tax=Actinoallomurus iriomotensis TaxID=478107 RepID=A0A9W6VWW3_9ACTN|nr:MarR family transcriptional regulator [Actinoallomurus iriomotensis]GLY83225.1 MarR family transcriptional regulator [Actinoallomurus iriomotensis]